MCLDHACVERSSPAPLDARLVGEGVDRPVVERRAVGAQVDERLVDGRALVRLAVEGVACALAHPRWEVEVVGHRCEPRMLRQVGPAEPAILPGLRALPSAPSLAAETRSIARGWR